MAPRPSWPSKPEARRPHRTADPADEATNRSVCASGARRAPSSALAGRPRPAGPQRARHAGQSGSQGTQAPSPSLGRERAVHLLRAVAFAYGRGLPWHKIWPLVANAVADDPERHYRDGDIAWLLNSRLGGYLVTGKEDDITVYRLSHDAMRIILRERWRDLLKVPDG